jgi:hypothetical protein
MKNFFLSKTMWANIIGLIIVTLQYAGTINWIPNDIMVFALAILNLILRTFFTSTKLNLK